MTKVIAYPAGKQHLYPVLVLSQVGCPGLVPAPSLDSRSSRETWGPPAVSSQSKCQGALQQT